jgi:hypothetical protein
MSFWNLLFSWLDSNGSTEPDDDFTSQTDNAVCYNPSTGLPMTHGNCGGVDQAGNPFGTNLLDDLSTPEPFDDWSTPGLQDDTWSP